MKRAALLGLATLLLPPTLAAQTPVAVVDPAGPVLHWGTPISFSTVRELSSKTLVLGQRIDLEVTDPVSVAGHVVIPRGTPAVGEVAAVTRKGNWGQRGRLQMRLLYVRVGDQMVRVSGGIGNEGHNGTAGTVAGVVLVGWPLGFFITGTSAVIPLGTGLSGYVDEDVPLAFGAAPVRTAVMVTPDVPPAPRPASYATK